MLEIIEILTIDSFFDFKYFVEIVKEFLIISGIIFASFIAYQIAFRELKFSAIKELIERDKNLRREFLNEISNAFSLYHDIFENNESDYLNNIQWNKLLKTFKNLSYKARNLPSEIAILTHLLYSSLFYSHKKIKTNIKDYNYFNRKIYFSAYINETLSDLNQACSSVIKFPSLRQFIFFFKENSISKSGKDIDFDLKNSKYSFFRFGLNYYKRSLELYNYVVSSSKTNNELIYESNFNELTFLLSHNLQIYLYIINKYLPGEIGIQSGIGNNISTFYLYNIKSEIQLDGMGATEIYSALYTQRRGGIRLEISSDSLQNKFSLKENYVFFDYSIKEKIKIPKISSKIEVKQIVGKKYLKIQMEKKLCEKLFKKYRKKMLKNINSN